MDELRDRVNKLEARVDTIEEAFPAGDFSGHRRAHQALIDDVESRKKLRQAIIEKTISGLIWSGILWIGLAAWHELQRRLGAG